jgi:hypothetical protein
VVVAAIAVFLLESVPHGAQIDDAYISFRYARNLVEGHGLVYNIGQHVEGFTNLLWVLLIALGMKLGGAAPLVSHWLGVSSGVALLVLAHAYARCLLHPKSVILAALALARAGVDGASAIWTVSGLETRCSPGSRARGARCASAGSPNDGDGGIRPFGAHAPRRSARAAVIFAAGIS